MEAITPVKKTPEEIENLKQNWKRDACWDIEDSEGFEAHKEELTAFRIQCEKEWEEAERKRLQDKAMKLGIPDRFDLVRYFENLEYQMKRMEERIYQLENN